MFVTRKEFRSLAVDLMCAKLRIAGLEKSMKTYFDEIREIIDNN